ncbi:uromodulin-like 1 [Mantella aurantiaca]
MDRRDILYLALILGLVAGLGNGQMLGSMISPLSYHVCERTATVNVSKVVPFQKPLQEKSLCMGWIPWKLCSKTYYVTEYRTIWVPETMIVKECCEGYEPVGHYCAMATKSPSLTTSRPGACPANIDEDVLCPECTVDYDCPGFQKCCETSTGSFCVSPKPPALDRNTIKFWYNGTFTIKMKFNELILLDPGYINHTRLLHAMVTGELWPLEVAVYHICTQSAGSFTIASRVFIGLNESVPLQNIATSLNNIAIRLPEVINVQLDDLDECLHRELGSCPPIHHCTNTEGSYNCSKPNSTQPPPPGDCSAFLSHSISGVTTNGFHLSWSTGCPDRHVYNIQISSAKGIHRNDSISGTSLTIRDLDAGEVYAVLVTFRGCSGETHAWEERVQTEYYSPFFMEKCWREFENAVHLPPSNRNWAPMSQGMPQHLTRSQGMPQHLTRSQGMPQHPTKSQGMPQHPIRSQGMPQHPTRSQGMPQHPTRSQGMPQHPIRSQGMPQHPTRSQGMMQHPTRSQGMTQHPTRSQGMPQHPTRSQGMPQHPNRSQGMPQHPTRSQGMPQHPNRSQGMPQHPNRSQGMPQHPTRSQGMPQHPNRSQGMPQHPNRSQGMPQHPTRSQGMPQHPNRSQGMPQHPTRSQGMPQHPTRSQGMPQHPTRSQSMPQHPTRSQGMPQHPTRSQGMPQHPTRSQGMPQHPTRSQGMPQHPTRARACRSIQPGARHPTRSQGMPQHPTRSQGMPQHQTRSQGMPQHSTRSQGIPQHPTRSQGMPQHPTRSQGMPQHPTKSQGMPQHPTRSQGMPQHPTRSQGMPQHPNRSQGMPQHPNRSQGMPQHPTRSQGMPQHQTRSQGMPQHPTRSQGMPQHPTRSQGMPQHPTRSQGMPQHPTRSQGMPQHPTRSQGMPQHPTKSQGMPQHPTRSQGMPQLPQLHAQFQLDEEGQILNATLKIENRNFTDSLLDPNSTDYKEFEETFISQVKQSLSGRIPPEKISVKILSLSPGSIDANFLITINDTVDYISDAMASLMAINESSGVFKVDPQSIKIAVVAGDLSPTSMASTESTVGISSTASNDTSPPTTSSTSEHVTDATAQSIQSTIELHQPTLPTDDATFAVSKPEIPKTGQSEQSSPITSTTEPLTHEAPITSTTEPLTHEAPITSTTEPLTHEAPITSTTEPLTHEAMNTDLIITALNDSKLTTIHGVDWTTNDKGNPTMTSTKHSTTKPTMSSSAGNKGVATLTSTTAKLATVQEVVCPLSVMSKISDAEATSMPRLALQATTTHRTPSLTLKDASKVICGTGMIGISMEKAFLKMMSISSHSLFLGSPECSVNCSTDTHIFIQAGWKECSTNVSSNATHIFVSSTLYIDLSTTNPNATPGVVSFIRCVFHNQFLWSSGYNPSGGFYTIIEKLEGGGTFFPEFQLFIGDQPIPPNFTLSATDDITVRIGIRTEESHFKVVINDCWATPTEDAYDSVTFPFIKNSCALPNTFTTIQTNGVSSNATFQTKIFSFVNKPIVYLHCRLSVCQEVVPNACKPSCSGLQASVRSGGNVFTGVTRMGPLRMASQAHDEDAPASATLGPGYIILIAIGVLAAISIIIAVLVCWHQRRTGNYNFRMKKRNASYRVFSN